MIKLIIARYIKSIMATLVASLAGYLAAQGIDIPTEQLADILAKLLDYLLPGLGLGAAVYLTIKETKDAEKGVDKKKK